MKEELEKKIKEIGHLIDGKVARTEFQVQSRKEHLAGNDYYSQMIHLQEMIDNMVP